MWWYIMKPISCGRFSVRETNSYLANGYFFFFFFPTRTTLKPLLYYTIHMYRYVYDGIYQIILSIHGGGCPLYQRERFRGHNLISEVRIKVKG